MDCLTIFFFSELEHPYSRVYKSVVFSVPQNRVPRIIIICPSKGQKRAEQQAPSDGEIGGMKPVVLQAVQGDYSPWGTSVKLHEMYAFITNK